MEGDEVEDEVVGILEDEGTLGDGVLVVRADDAVACGAGVFLDVLTVVEAGNDLRALACSLVFAVTGDTLTRRMLPSPETGTSLTGTILGLGNLPAAPPLVSLDATGSSDELLSSLLGDSILLSTGVSLASS